MFRVLLGFVLLGLIIWLVVKLWRSVKFDKWCNDLTKGKLDTPESSKDAMNDITKKEDVLGKQVNVNIKEAEKLKSESENITDFLSDRGAKETKKEGGSK